MAARLTKDQGLCQVHVAVPGAAEEPASALLESVFSQTPASFAQPESTTVQISVFLPAKQKPTRHQLATLAAGFRDLAAHGVPLGHPRVRVTRLPNRDWKHSWKRHFKPIQIGRRLLLRPSWSLRRAEPGQAVVVLDPGLSFGTGQHPTTSFCLRTLVNARRNDQAQSFLDIGTGSGILAIAAAKLGYRPVQAFDCDPDAVRVARANARRNRVGERMRIQEADLRTFCARRARGHDVVCANLLADLLVAESGKILQQVKPGGLLVIAGILAREFDCVNRHYIAAGARLLRSCSRGEWQSAAYRVPA